MKVREVMSSDVQIASPDQTIQEAARVMADIDAGSAAGGGKRPAGRHDHGP